MHHGQAELPGELEKKIGDDTRVIPWSMLNALFGHDGKGRVVKTGIPKSDYELVYFSSRSNIITFKERGTTCGIGEPQEALAEAEKMEG